MPAAVASCVVRKVECYQAFFWTQFGSDVWMEIHHLEIWKGVFLAQSRGWILNSLWSQFSAVKPSRRFHCESYLSLQFPRPGALILLIECFRPNWIPKWGDFPWLRGSSYSRSGLSGRYGIQMCERPPGEVQRDSSNCLKACLQLKGFVGNYCQPYSWLAKLCNTCQNFEVFLFLQISLFQETVIIFWTSTKTKFQGRFYSPLAPMNAPIALHFFKRDELTPRLTNTLWCNLGSSAVPGTGDKATTIFAVMQCPVFADLLFSRCPTQCWSHLAKSGTLGSSPATLFSVLPPSQAGQWSGPGEER